MPGPPGPPRSPNAPRPQARVTLSDAESADSQPQKPGPANRPEIFTTHNSDGVAAEPETGRRPGPTGSPAAATSAGAGAAASLGV